MFSVGSVLATPVFGILCDNPKYGRRKPALASLLLLACAVAFFGIGEYYGLLVLARVLEGIGSAGAWVGGYVTTHVCMKACMHV